MNKLIVFAFDVLDTIRNSKRLAMAFTMLFCMMGCMYAQKAGDYSAGTTALQTVASEIAKYVPTTVNVCYAIAGVVAVVGSISVFMKMSNEENDCKKSVMMIVGACLFLVAAAKALPLFFGLS